MSREIWSLFLKSPGIINYQAQKAAVLIKDQGFNSSAVRYSVQKKSCLIARG